MRPSSHPGMYDTYLIAKDIHPHDDDAHPPGMYGTYLIAKDQLYLDKACRVNLAPWLEENGWNASFCSRCFSSSFIAL